MNHELKAGDRVRVTGVKNVSGYRPGDTGTVKEGPHPAAAGGHYYIVQMDKRGEESIIFMDDEIEPAV
jgi:hypothetical protein